MNSQLQDMLRVLHVHSVIAKRTFSPFSDCHTLLDSANVRVMDSKILCPFVSVCMRFLSVLHAANVFSVR